MFQLTQRFSSTVNITIVVENEIVDNMYQRSNMDWLMYNALGIHAGMVLIRLSKLNAFCFALDVYTNANLC